jgi:hypothetical protein
MKLFKISQHFLVDHPPFAMAPCRGVHFQFGSVFIKKNNQTEIFFLKKLKPNRNRFKPTGFGSVRFFRTKTGSNRFGSFFPVWLGFFGFGSVFSGLGSVRFSSVFSVPGLKNRNRTEPVGFFKILIGLIDFFHGSVFLIFFLPVFSI